MALPEYQSEDLDELEQTADILFLHSEINNGEPQGFLLFDGSYRLDLDVVQELHNSVMVIRDKDENGVYDTSMIVALKIGDDLQAANGGIREITEAGERMRLDQYLKKEEFVVVTSRGVYGPMFSDGGVITEKQLTRFTVVIFKLKSAAANMAPPGPFLFLNSLWVDEDTLPAKYSHWISESEPDPIGEETGYWRTE